MESTLAYSSTTGQQSVIAPRFESHPAVLAWQFDPFCFVCGRVTDHVAEHDDLVDAGTAKYGTDGDVYSIDRTPWQF